MTSHELLNSSASQLFAKKLIKAKKIGALYYWPFVQGIHWWPVGGFHAQRFSNGESLPTSWSHHDAWTMCLICMYCNCSPCALDNMFMYTSGISLGMRSANERRCYILTTFLIGWVHTSVPDWSNAFWVMIMTLLNTTCGVVLLQPDPWVQWRSLHSWLRPWPSWLLTLTFLIPTMSTL